MLRTTEEQIHENAQNSLKDHIIEELSGADDHVRIFWCGRPDHRMRYSFQILVWPGYIAVHGDIGHMTLRREHDMIEWSREAIKSPRYFFEKSTEDLAAMTCWDDRAFKKWLKDQIEQDKEAWESGDRDVRLWTAERIAEAKEAASGYPTGDPLRDLYLYVETLDVDLAETVSSCKDYNSRLWWCREAVRKFLELYDALPKPEKKTA